MRLSHSALIRGTWPSRCAMNSSARTELLISISTMSIATQCHIEFTTVIFREKDSLSPTVAMSAMTTRRNELAKL